MMFHRAFNRSRVLGGTGVLPSFAYMGCAVLALWVSSTSAFGAYMLTPISNNQDTVAVDRGDSFTLDLVLTSGTSDEIDTAEIAVVFSESGLQLDGITWQEPFASGLIGSTPSGLPAIIVDNSFENPGSDIDVFVDGFINTSNLFTSGLLVSLDITVPSGFSPDTVTIGVNPINLINNGVAITTNVGPSLTLNVVPEPSSALLLGLGGILLVGSRRNNP